MTTTAPSGSSTPKVNCRTIELADLEAVAQCLARGFPDKKIEHWRIGLDRMTHRVGVAGCPKYGYCLDVAGEIVGVLLQIYSQRVIDGEPRVQCNLSSWCVDPNYRMYAPALSMGATKRKDITYYNISPARHTRKSIEAMGFRRYVRGQMIFAPMLTRGASNTRVVAFDETTPEAALLPESEREILAEHRAMGCRAFVGLREGVAFGFVSAPSLVFRDKIRCEQIVYFRDAATLSAFAGAIGAHLAKSLRFLCLVDANEPIAGLVGRYVPGRSLRYSRGPNPPRVGDLAYSELIVLRECAAAAPIEDRSGIEGLLAPRRLQGVLDFAANRGLRQKAAIGVAPPVGADDNVTRVEFSAARVGRARLSLAKGARAKSEAADGPSAPAINHKLDRVRAFDAADVPRVAEMFRDVFRQPRDRGSLKTSAVAADLEEIFLRHPHYDAESSARILERQDGEIGGFLGMIPIPFVLDGARVSGGALSTWMIRDPKLDIGAGAKLLRAHLGAPRALTLVDTANSKSLTFARSMKITVLTPHSLHWAAPLNYSGFATLRLTGAGGADGPAGLASWVKRPEDWARRLGAKAAAPTSHASNAIDAETFAEHFVRFSRDFRLRPDWSRSDVAWMLTIAGRRTAPGKLHLREVIDRRGAVVGCHAFHAIPGGRATALQALAEPPNEALVLGDLIDRARMEGCVVVGGPTSPRLLRGLFTLPNIYYRHACAAGVYAPRTPEVTNAILAGGGLAGGLVGDSWTPLSTESYQ